MPVNANPIAHSQGGHGYWIKLPVGKTPRTFPLDLLYDADEHHRPSFEGLRIIQYCAQTYDNSKAFVIAWTGESHTDTYPDSMTPVPYEIVPVLMEGGNAVRVTSWRSTTMPGHYGAFENVEAVNANSVRAWGTYDIDSFNSDPTNTLTTFLTPIQLVSGTNQPIGGRVVIRQYVSRGGLNWTANDNAFRWTGKAWAFDRTLASFDFGGFVGPPPLASLEYQVAFTRTFTFRTTSMPPIVSGEQNHIYNPDGSQIPGNEPGAPFYDTGYVLVTGPDGDGPGRISVMIDTEADDTTKVVLTSRTDLKVGDDLGSQEGDVCPIADENHALYAAMDADGLTMHFGLLGPPLPSLAARPGPRRVNFIA